MTITSCTVKKCATDLLRSADARQANASEVRQIMGLMLWWVVRNEYGEVIVLGNVGNERVQAPVGCRRAGDRALHLASTAASSGPHYHATCGRAGLMGEHVSFE